MPATAAMRGSATEAGSAACRKTSCLSAMTVASEGAGADAGLTAGFSVSSSSLGVCVERMNRYAGAVVNSAAPADGRGGGPVLEISPQILGNH
jgi:hypothetical protein